MYSSKINLALIAGLVVTSASMLISLTPSQAGVETGPAKFLRDHDSALALSKKKNKPVFAFFQEVPG